MYLNELDQFVKRRLRCRYYLRYVDDLVLLAEQQDELLRWRDEIEAFLRERLRLALRAGQREPFPVGRGVEFVGWRTWWNRRLPRRRALGNLRARLDAFERQAVRPAFGGQAQRIDLRRADLARLRSVLASYSGHLRRGQARRNWEAAWERRPWLGALFARQGWAVAERWPQPRIEQARRFQSQYRELVRRAGEGCLVFCQVGRFVEFRDQAGARAQLNQANGFLDSRGIAAKCHVTHGAIGLLIGGKAREEKGGASNRLHHGVPLANAR